MQLAFTFYIIIGIILLWIIGGICWFIFFFRKKSFIVSTLGLIAASLPFLFVYSITYTPSSNYKSLFERITDIPFPKTAKIVQKKSSSGFLDHSTAAVIQLQTEDFDRILNHVRNTTVLDRDTTDGTIWFHPGGYGRDLLEKARIPNTGFDHKFGRGSGYSIGFHRNRRLVVIEDINW